MAVGLWVGVPQQGSGVAGDPGRALGCGNISSRALEQGYTPDRALGKEGGTPDRAGGDRSRGRVIPPGLWNNGNTQYQGMAQGR